jgi:type IV secretory pathway ATPase VirB11/archaellum biosynthesis ATPase
MPISMRINNRDFEAELMPDLTIVIRESGNADVTYTMSDAFDALLPQGPDYILRSTADEAIRALVSKHADRP